MRTSLTGTAIGAPPSGIAIVAAQQSVERVRARRGVAHRSRRMRGRRGRSCRHLRRFVASLEDVLDLAPERSLGRRERAVEDRRSDREGVDAGFAERVDTLRRIHAAGDDQLFSRQRVARRPDEVERVGLGRPIGEKIHAAAAQIARTPAMVGDERRRASQPGRMADRVAGKRKVARQVAQDVAAPRRDRCRRGSGRRRAPAPLPAIGAWLRWWYSQPRDSRPRRAAGSCRPAPASWRTARRRP